MNPPDPDFRLRPAAPHDLPALAGLWATAFPGERSADARLAELRDGTGPYGGVETCWVGEAEGKMVGALRTYAFTLHLRGTPFPMQGLAAVAVSPEARRRGVGGKMCCAALAEGRKSGRLLSALYPFRADFYARLGYTLVGEYHRYRFAPEELPAFAEADRVVMLSPEEALRRVPAFYREMLPRTSGLVERDERHWSHLGAEGVRVLAVPGEVPDTLEGYMAVDLPRHLRPEDARIEVREFLASEAGGYRALLGWLSRQRDQWRAVVYDALPGEGFHQLLGHPRRPRARPARRLWFPSATILRGPMLRILDLPGVLARWRFPEGARIEVDDPLIAENTGAWTGGAGAASIRSAAVSEPLPIRVVTGLLASGALPGGEGPGAWQPALGLDDFRLWDTF